MPTITELKAEAKSKGLKGYSKLNKTELMALVNKGGSSSPAKPAPAKAKSPVKAEPKQAKVKQEKIIKAGDQVIVKGVKYEVMKESHKPNTYDLKEIKSRPYYKGTLDKKKMIRTLKKAGENHRLVTGVTPSLRTVSKTRMKLIKDKVDLETIHKDDQDLVMPSRNFEPLYKDVYV